MYREGFLPMSRTSLLRPTGSGDLSQAEANQRLLTTAEASIYLRVSKSYLDKLRVYGGGPRFLRLGKRKVLYRKADLDAWLAGQSFDSTSEYESTNVERAEKLSNKNQRNTAMRQALYKN